MEEDLGVLGIFPRLAKLIFASRTFPVAFSCYLSQGASVSIMPPTAVTVSDICALVEWHTQVDDGRFGECQ